MKISLNLLVKDETDLLKNLLESVNPANFHEIVVVIDPEVAPKETIDILNSYNCRILHRKWDNDFSKARQYAQDHSTGDFIAWFDADDTVKNAKGISQVCENVFSNPRAGSVWFPYYYDFDKHGNCTMLLYRERVFRKENYQWVGRLHEVALQTADLLFYIDDTVKVYHRADKKHIEASAVRNLKILEEVYKEQHATNTVDARDVFYYARSLFAMDRIAEAAVIFEEYVGISGWDEERYEAYCKMALIHRTMNNYDKSFNCDLTAIKILPRRPDAYLGMAETAFCLENWEDVVHFTQVGLSLEPPKGASPINPMRYEVQPLLGLAWAYLQLGKAQEAIVVSQQILKVYPDNKYAKKVIEQCNNFIKQIDLENSVLKIKKYLDLEEPEKTKTFLNALPKCMEDFPSIARERQKLYPIDKDICIYCGATFEEWSPESEKTGEGWGGSEEAVVNMARELVKLGYSVDVYNSGNPGTWDGVNYYPFWTFSQDSKYKIFIAWRYSGYIEKANKDSRKFVWLHDIQKPETWNDDRIKDIEKILVLSKYHRGNVGFIKDDSKFFITKNGINTKLFPEPSKKDNFNCIYASSPDRGLEILLDLWEKIYEQVPQAKLNIYYGFTKTYDKLSSGNYPRIQFKQKILSKIASLHDKGVVYHGKVGVKDLYDAFNGSVLWLYPTEFTEISCITGMIAQYSNCMPICTTVAALDETVQHGIKVNCDRIYTEKDAQKQFIDSTVHFLRNTKDRELLIKGMKDWTKENYDWSIVAKDWSRLFGKDSK